MSDSAANESAFGDVGPRESFAIWQRELGHARERLWQLRAERESNSNLADVAEPFSDPLDELTRAFEELAVAEEELRTQNDELLQTHALQARETLHYRELFEHAPVAYIVTDALGVIRTANRSACGLLRCRVDRLPGKPVVVFGQDASRRRIRRVIARLNSTPSPTVTLTLNLTARGGVTRRVRATVAATTDYRGVVQELRWLFVDRSRQAEREQVRRADAVELKRLVAERTSALEHEQRLKDQLVATVSHEFRTALSAIGGYAELLAIGVRGALSVEQLEDVGRIRRANHHLVGIVDDLLSYSKLTAGTMAFDVDDMNVSDVMPTALELVAEQARLKRISVQLAPLGENVLVRADSDRVRQIIINLVGNAVKFTGEDGRVEVTVEANDADVRIRVCDTGPGIEPHALESIFQPFIRLQRTVAGTGLGLAISRELARAMKGDLVATSELGVGSCFELRLPRA